MVVPLRAKDLCCFEELRVFGDNVPLAALAVQLDQPRTHTSEVLGNHIIKPRCAQCELSITQVHINTPLAVSGHCMLMASH